MVLKDLLKFDAKKHTPRQGLVGELECNGGGIENQDLAAVAHVNTARTFEKGQGAEAMSKPASHKAKRAHYSVEHPGLLIIAALGQARHLLQ